MEFYVDQQVAAQFDVPLGLTKSAHFDSHHLCHPKKQILVVAWMANVLYWKIICETGVEYPASTIIVPQ
jgi:hypothetical protein